MTQQAPVTLIGAGLAGSLLALFLARRGIAVRAFERRPDPRAGTPSAGRSINLALSARGIDALARVGLDRDILSIAIPMRGRMMHAVDGTRTFQPYGQRPEEVIHSVSRAELNKRLLGAAEALPSVALHFSLRCEDVDVDACDALFVDERGGERQHVSGATVIGTDGAASALRDAMLRRGGHRCTQDMLEHGYKELTIHPGPDGAFRMEADVLHIWPRSSFMMIALPNPDRTFTCTLFLQREGATSFDSLRDAESVRSFFAQYFPDALALMPQLEEEFFANPTGHLGTVRVDRWHAEGKALLLGDAAHAIVPFFGQGMNCAFEDCVALDHAIERHGADWARVFAEVQHRRKDNADAIADMALRNFIEMRDLVADPRFLFMKRAGLVLERHFPDYFVPMYSMVSFHLLPYATALRRGLLQQRILEQLTEGVARIEDIDLDAARRLITATLPPFVDDAGM